MTVKLYMMMKRHGIRLWVGVLLSWIVPMVWLSTLCALTPQTVRAADEYDFSWLDPDKKIYVLQNRKYVKANRPFIALMGGIGLSQTYRSLVNLEPHIGYYFNEEWAVDLLYTRFVSTPNGADTNLRTFTSVVPVIRDFQSQFAALVHWTPFYSKLNFFNQILYYDWSFHAGLGQLSVTVDQNTDRTVAAVPPIPKQYTTFYLGTTQQYHLSRDWFVRLDVTGAFFQAESLGTSGPVTWFSNFNFSAGLGYRL